MIDQTPSIERVKKAMMDRHFYAAVEHMRKAISLNPYYEPAIRNLQRSTEGR